MSSTPVRDHASRVRRTLPIPESRIIRKRVLLATAAAAGRVNWKVQPLAIPPPGSGLEPVMGEFGVPWIGAAINAMTDQLRWGRRHVDKYGEISWAGLFGRRVVAAIGPDATREVLIDRDKNYSVKGFGFLIGPFFDGGLLLRDFDDHRYHRRILQQAFTRGRLAGYLELTTPAILDGLRHWEPDPAFPLYDRGKQLLLELATTVFVGADLGPEADRLTRAFEDAVRGGQAIVRHDVPGGRWRRGLRGRRILQDYFRAALPGKRAAETADLFSVLCHARSEDGDRLTDDEVIDHMIFVLMAAHDTSTNALSMMGYFLARHPQWQERLRAESVALGKDTLEYADIAGMTGLELVFKETLRLTAPVGQELRETVRDTALCGKYIPAGTLVNVNPYLTMRSLPWNDPDRFDPERHAGEDGAANRFAFAPFGGGAHQCLGQHFARMTVFAIMHRLLLDHSWSVAPGYTVSTSWGTGPTPDDGLPIRLERRPPTGTAEPGAAPAAVRTR